MITEDVVALSLVTRTSGCDTGAEHVDAEELRRLEMKGGAQAHYPVALARQERCR
ncbi:hypothetical protein [Ferrimicrobium sp.]|uniref:hypothetical protein n=1 Tax=Ferrimicrobium sp. TaxID=2926050 RepID=UPI002603B0D6|nr:hypothetical protein [Ferrimicrobium sp.]